MTSIVRTLRNNAAVATLTIALVSGAAAQDGKPPEAQKPKATPEKAAIEKLSDTDAGRYCASVAPSMAEARIVWQTRRLAQVDELIRQRIAELEKAETAAHEWIERRDAMMKAARDDLVAIYAKMEPESAAAQLGALDDRAAAAILARLKPPAAAAILGEMEAERASRLEGFIAGAGADEKKS
jgi:flagellar motility protein MotE (MotC chaperone)